MKQLGKFLGVTLTAAAVAACCAVTALADEEQPKVVLKESGAENEFVLRLDKFSSNFESVQFDICIDGKINEPEVVWRDDSPSNFHKINTNVQEDGKTVMTVYIDQLKPIANSNSVELAEITFRQSLPASKFSVGEEMIALDENQEKTVFKPTLSVSVSNTGDFYDSDDDDDSSDVTTPSRTVLSWSDVTGRVTQNRLTVNMGENELVGREIFRQAKEKAESLVLDYDDYMWTFHLSNGVSVPSNRIYYDLSINKIRYKNLAAAVENSDLVQFEISYSGPLPCKATLSYPVGERYAGQTVYLAYYNEKDAVLEYRGSTQVDSNGMASFDIEYASKYVICTKNFWKQEKQEGVTNLSASNATANPTTGDGGALTVLPEDRVQDIEDASDSQVLQPTPEEELSDSGDEDQETAVTAPETIGTIDSGNEQKAETTNRMTPVLVLFLVIAVAAVIGVVIKIRVK